MKILFGSSQTLKPAMIRLIVFFVKIIFLLAISVALFVGALLLNVHLSDYQPEAQESISSISSNKVGIPTLTIGTDLSFITWNLGFAGFGKESDFFYDGGQMVIPQRSWHDKNLLGIKNFIQQQRNTDFFLFQEIDMGAKRSYYQDHVAQIASLLPKYAHAFATNYRVKFIPYPLEQPLGSVHSGLVTYSKYAPSASTRHSFPGNFSWPKHLFLLDRCFLLQRYSCNNGKELVVINTHNSAYDDGSLKKQQMDHLKQTLLAEYNKGNYVLVGGDWNHLPQDFDNNTFLQIGAEATPEVVIPADYLPTDWTWAYDPSIPSNRKLPKPYNPDETFCTILDFFLLSPNIDLLSVKTFDQQFEFSDHQPVQVKITLK
jgi:endonuclease/exonuclease/phosphatase family metal-dependent hydrolase